MFVPKSQNTVKVYEQKNAIQKNAKLGDYYITQQYFEQKMKSFSVHAGDIIVSCAGTIGETYVLPQKIEPGIINQALMRMRIYSPINVDYFLLYFDYIIKQTSIKNSKGSAIKNIPPFDVFKRILFPVPPFKEQNRIVNKIQEIEFLLKKYQIVEEQLCELNSNIKEKLKKSILQYAIEGKLVSQDPNDEPASVLLERIRKEKQKLIGEGKIKKDKTESIIYRRDNSYYEKLNKIEHCIDEDILFEIPKNWEWTRLKNIASVLGGKRIPAGSKLTSINTGHIYIRVSDMKNGTVILDNLLYVPESIFPFIEKYIINKEDVYITVAGTIGRVGKIPDELDGANLTENADRLISTHINQDWLILKLQSPFIQNQISSVTTKVGQPKLAIKRIENLLLALPPLETQKYIVNIINQITKLLEN